MASDLDQWIEIVKQCKYLPENDLKKLCDIVCELLIEESNVQPVSTPVTVCGDIHGQVRFVTRLVIFLTELRIYLDESRVTAGRPVRGR